MSDAHLTPANSADKTKRNGSHLEPHCKDTKRNGSGRGGDVGQHPRNTKTKSSGSHLDNSVNVSGSNNTGVRGGGGIKGHDRPGRPKRSVRSTQSPRV